MPSPPQPPPPRPPCSIGHKISPNKILSIDLTKSYPTSFTCHVVGAITSELDRDHVTLWKLHLLRENNDFTIMFGYVERSTNKINLCTMVGQVLENDLCKPVNLGFITYDNSDINNLQQINKCMTNMSKDDLIMFFIDSSAFKQDRASDGSEITDSTEIENPDVPILFAYLNETGPAPQMGGKRKTKKSKKSKKNTRR